VTSAAKGVTFEAITPAWEYSRSSQMTRPPKRDRTTDANADVDHFAEAMADVVPLAPDDRGRVRAAPVVATRRKAPAPASSSASAGDDDGAGADEGYAAPGVDRRELRKLKRGDYAAGGTLDLHGQTAAEAVANVKQFIDSRRFRHRCVAIVHGRGLHSKGNVSVLKARVRQYLRRHPAVLAYADAPRTDGGGGAVYVLLRK
jgi:DNA-nicking Smr family endonuclease